MELSAITSEVIREATDRFEATGNIIKRQTGPVFTVRQICAWCAQLLRYGRGRHKHKLCSPCAQIYIRKINTFQMLELQAMDLDLYQSAKADIFSDGVRHGA